MTKSKKFMILVILFIASIFLFFFVKTKLVYSNSIWDYLNATVKISICGNQIIEGGEDCEGGNLNGQTCESLGFGPGILSCDIACSFDTYNCSPTPTSTPTPTLTPTSTPTPSTTSVDNSDSTTVENVSSPTISPSITPIPTPSLPSFLNPFDPDKDGKITLRELFTATKTWVEEWRRALAEEIASLNQESGTQQQERKCDLNQDYHCNLKDFSILMSYVGK